MKRGFIERHDLARSEWEQVLYQRISSERDREIFERTHLDGVPYEQVAVEFDMSVRQIKAIAKTIEQEMEKHITHNL